MTKANSKKSFLLQLFERRVPNIVGIYLGMSWVMIEFAGWISERYSLPPSLPDYSLVALITILPSIILVAWNHGRPGRDDWTKAEKRFLPINAILMVVILSGMMLAKDETPHKSIGPKQNEAIVQISDRIGRTPRVAFFNLKNMTDNAELNWLSIAIPFAVAWDLDQNIQLAAISALDRDMLAAQKDSAFSYEDVLPLSLMRQLTEQYFFDYFLTGELQTQYEDLQVTLKVFDVKSNELVFSASNTGPDIFISIDKLSQSLSKHFTPDNIDYLDLPVAELLSEKKAALKLLIEAIAKENAHDYPLALRNIEEALKIDPNFAAALLFKAGLHFVDSDNESAFDAINKALKLSYKFSESKLNHVKQLYYLLKGDFERLRKLNELNTEKDPSERDRHIRLARQLAEEEKYTEAIKAYEAILALDPESKKYTLDIASLYIDSKALGKAEQYIKQYIADFPKRTEGYFKLADLYAYLNDVKGQKTQYEKILLLEPTNFPAQLALIMLDLDSEHLTDIPRKIKQLLNEIPSDDNRVRAYAALQTYYRYVGQPRKALSYVHKRVKIRKKLTTPVNYFLEQLTDLPIYIEANQVEKAEAIASSIVAELEPPYDGLAPIGFTILNIAKKNGEQAWRHLKELEKNTRVMKGFLKFKSIELTYLKAEIEELRGHHKEALRLYELVDQKAPKADYFALARVHRKLGNQEMALHYFAICQRRRPNHPEMNLEFAKLQYQLGNHEAARKLLNKSLKVWLNADPDFAPAKEARELAAAWRSQGNNLEATTFQR